MRLQIGVNPKEDKRFIVHTAAPGKLDIHVVVRVGMATY